MTDQEFVTEIRRAVIILVRACIKKYGMAWADFLPREDQRVTLKPAENQTLTVSAAVVIDLTP